jgi:uncharacterized protein YciI
MATNPILGRDVYLALAAVGWADGQLTSEAADAIVRTALEEGLELDVVAEIEAATKKPIDVGVVDRMRMSKSDRLYVYAVASWIAALDHAPSEKAQVALKKLARELGVPEPPRVHADAIMKDIAAQDDRPARFDLRALRRTLDEMLEEAAAVRRRNRAATREGSAGGADVTGETSVESEREHDSESDASEADTLGERPRVDVRFVIVLKPGPEWTPGVDFRHQEGIEEHTRYYRALLATGKLDMGGPFLDDSGAMMVPVAGLSEADVAEFAVKDPAVVRGVVTFEIRKWYLAMRRSSHG